MPANNELFFSSNSIEETQTKIRDIFDRKSSIPLAIISKEKYDAHEASEREDSDNHLQAVRLGKETNVIPLIYRKYTRGTDRNEYYRVVYKHVNGTSTEDYLMIIPDFE